MSGQAANPQLAANLDFRCCRTEIEVYRCGHSTEFPVQCHRVIAPDDLFGFHMVTHRLRTDVARVCDNCMGEYWTMEFHHETNGPLVPLAGPHYPKAPGPGTHYQNPHLAGRTPGPGTHYQNPYLPGGAHHVNAFVSGRAYHPNAPVAAAARQSDAHDARAASANAPETTTQSPDEGRQTAESDESSPLSSPESSPERNVAPNKHNGPRTRRELFAEMREVKMQKELAERPPRQRRGGRGS